MSTRFDNEFSQALDALLADTCTAAAVRALEAGGPIDALWQPVVQAGFADALLPEHHGGAGLGWAEAGGLWFTLGRHAYPLPLGATQYMRQQLCTGGLSMPAGPIALASQVAAAEGDALACKQVPGGLWAEQVACLQGGRWHLLPVLQASRRQVVGIHADAHAHLHWPAPLPGLNWPAQGASPLVAGALITAAHMAGALDAVLARTVAFCEQRVQFGKPIAKYQAVQHQLAVMAEEAAAARMAVEMACADRHLHPLRVAMAKARCGDAAATVAPMAHALHGAIGVTAEFELQRFTRALHAWRNDYGAAPYWYGQIGQAALAARGSSFHFIETELTPS